MPTTMTDRANTARELADLPLRSDRPEIVGPTSPVLATPAAFAAGLAAAGAVAGAGAAGAAIGNAVD